MAQVATRKRGVSKPVQAVDSVRAHGSVLRGPFAAPQDGGMGVTSYPRNAVPLVAPKVGHADPAAAVLAPAQPFQWVGRQNLSHNQVRPLLFGPQFDIACLFTSERRAGAFHDGMDVFTPPVGLGQGAASPGGANGRESQSSSRRKRPEAGQGGKKRRG